jgi:hypothetical protein
MSVGPGKNSSRLIERSSTSAKYLIPQPKTEETSRQGLWNVPLGGDFVELLAKNPNLPKSPQVSKRTIECPLFLRE